MLWNVCKGNKTRTKKRLNKILFQQVEKKINCGTWHERILLLQLLIFSKSQLPEIKKICND